MTNEEKATKIAESLNKANGSNCLLPCHQAAIAMAEWKDSQPQIIEIFGKRVKAVVGDDSCENCVFQESVCKYISRGNLCQSADKKFNRHFVEVEDDGNDKGGQND